MFASATVPNQARPVPMAQPATAQAQPVSAVPIAGQPIIVDAQPMPVMGQPVMAQPVQPVQPMVMAQPMVAGAAVAPTPVQMNDRAMQVDAFGFVLRESSAKYSAKQIAGCYVGCIWLFCPFPMMRCRKFKEVDWDTIEQSCGCNLCPLCDVPKPLADDGRKVFHRNTGEDGQLLGPANSFTRTDGMEAFEVGKFGICSGDTESWCYCRLF